MALLSLLVAWRGAQDVHAATVDHGLRSEARAEAEMVANYCHRHGVAHAILPIPSLAPTGNLQANARHARYRALTTWAHGIAPEMPVMLGHTMDDQAETVLMRLARGSGAEGLSGMAEEIMRDRTRFCRPLLGFRRASLREWLEASGTPWVEDPSNEDTAFYRIKARQALEILTPLGLTVEGLAATADRLRRQSCVLHADADRLRGLAVEEADAHARIDRHAFRNAEADTAMRLLAQILQRIGANPYRPRFRSLSAVHAKLIGRTDIKVTLAGCLISTEGEQILIRPEATR